MPDATSFSPWGAAANAAGGLINAGIGFIQRGQANRWLKRNQEPTETMPVEVRRNQQLAEIGANTGMPSQQYNNAMKSIMRNQLQTIRSARELGGGKGLSILGGVNEYGNDAVNDLNARDAAMRIDNQGRLIDVNNQVAGWKSKLFDSNVRQRWLRQYNQMMNQLGTGNQNIVSGADKILAGAPGFFGGGGNTDTGRTGQVTNTGVLDAPIQRTQIGVPNMSGNSQAASFGNVQFNPAIYSTPGLRRYLNRGI